MSLNIAVCPLNPLTALSPDPTRSYRSWATSSDIKPWKTVCVVTQKVGVSLPSPLEQLLYVDSSDDFRLSKAVEDFVPVVCWLRQNENVARLIWPTVPVVGVVDTINWRPPTSLPAVPLPSAKHAVLTASSIVLFRLSSFRALTSNLPPPLLVIAFSNSENGTSPPMFFQANSASSNGVEAVVSSVSYSDIHLTFGLMAYSRMWKIARPLCCSKL